MQIGKVRRPSLTKKLNELIMIYGLTKTELAQGLGLSRVGLYNILNDKSIITRQRLTNILDLIPTITKKEVDECYELYKKIIIEERDDGTDSVEN